MKKKPTYAEISKISGISISTISRIMNGKTFKKNEKTEKIINAIEKLGFDSSKLSINCIEKNNIIYNIPDIENPIYADITKGLKDSAKRNNFNILIHEGPINEETIEAMISLLKSLGIKGLITQNQIDDSILDRLKTIVPIVQCGETSTNSNVPFVSIDDVEAAKKAVSLLVSNNRKKISIITCPSRFKCSNDRFKGYKEILEKNNYPIIPNHIIELTEFNFDMALSAIVQVLSSSNLPDAFFAISDIYAIAAIKACQKMKLRVPEDIEIIGFDNIKLSYMSTPTITTISQSRYQQGLLCGDMIHKLINKENVNSIYLDTELIIRESTK